LLHDLGKIGIPDALLLKRSKLTPEEYGRIMLHVEIGVEILQAIASLRELAHFVRHHHEHYDGSGYPDGLKGDDIPLASRVIAVADAIDAMRSTRPYRPRLSLEETIAELKKNRGTQFDPQVVDSAIKVLSGTPSVSPGKNGRSGPPPLPGDPGSEVPSEMKDPAELLVAVGE
jgi:HD-GYP domain-containing protein (c-di-GMP phosphodiesterase class II)